MEDDISRWILRPDVCRCCLSASGTWDMTAAYITDSGVKEVFADILLDCFNISLSHSNESSTSHMVCELCVSHLRGASSFHHQVLQADQFFTQYWQNRKGNDNVASEDLKTYNDGIVIETKRIDNSRSRMLKIENNYNESDSDTPLSKLKGYSLNSNSSVQTETTENKLKSCVDKIDVTVIEQPKVKLKIHHKQVSERKRVILTCGTVLKDTTACPFRHHKSWFQCFFCSQDFMEIKLLRHHTLKNHPDIESELKKIKRYPRSLQIEISNLECRGCRLTLTDVENMARHFDEKHSKVIYKECIADYKVNTSPYTCHLCQKEFHVFRSLTTHLNEHYANCICDVCGKSFLNSKRLKVHKRTHESGAYPCTRCDRVLKTKTSMSNHMESAHSKRTIKCHICFKPMKHYNDRIKHMSEAHNITHTFKCPFCDREYNIKHYLSTHIRQTHGNKNKKCAECDMVFITNHGLKKHMLKHTGERPFSCSVCSKSYARSYTLREHMRVHENDNRYGSL